MFRSIKYHAVDWLKRIAALFDKSALLLIVPAVALLYRIYPPIIQTNLELSLYVAIFVGMTIILTILAFPQINIELLIRSVLEEKNLAAALVVVAMIVFFIAIFLGLLQWAPRQS
jgi:hypothetical protein